VRSKSGFDSLGTKQVPLRRPCSQVRETFDRISVTADSCRRQLRLSVIVSRGSRLRRREMRGHEPVTFNYDAGARNSAVECLTASQVVVGSSPTERSTFLRGVVAQLVEHEERRVAGLETFGQNVHVERGTPPSRSEVQILPIPLLTARCRSSTVEHLLYSPDPVL
jgi:hypothetical protein